MSRLMRIADYPYKSRHSLYDLLMDFSKCSDLVAEIVYSEDVYKDSRSMAYSLRTSIERFRWPFKVVNDHGRIYLFKTLGGDVMKFEAVDRAVVSRGYKYCKVQRRIEEFHRMDCKAVRCVFDKDEYATLSSAQSTFSRAVRKLGYRMCVRAIEGNLYLIKLD